MKSMIAFSLLVAASVAQPQHLVYPASTVGHAFVPYAANFGYNTYAVPAGRTALDVFQPTLNTPQVLYTGYRHPGYATAFAPLSPAAVVEAAPSKVLVKAAIAEEAAAAEDVVVEEADAAPIKVDFPINLRPIFPFFTGGLRAGNDGEEITFLRPDQVAPIQPVTEIKVEEEAAEDDEEVPSVVIPDFSFRSALPGFPSVYSSAPAAQFYHPYTYSPYYSYPNFAFVQ